ncbi:hypothetical protein E2562_025836 [Oryza meyeriana var. granulata]|uniref:Uncharacterized protein n=1 Tax=Oryza meyeriana var. granulata TaxID=110450 RepID=A0A6G1E1P5_9ORYZ|nr:hypothetical protein E2562_025836 [Oryza meyeriana var. granulata]
MADFGLGRVLLEVDAGGGRAVPGADSGHVLLQLTRTRTAVSLSRRRQPLYVEAEGGNGFPKSRQAVTAEATSGHRMAVAAFLRRGGRRQPSGIESEGGGGGGTLP